ncbi:LysR family transcriptional regulator [Spiribacter halobius]|uniref:LysR family transcriptional regulator n=1 Tax=Sediminicurvatus halobius TaxID=2182432 RepID=UPI0018EE5238|nr:LysR family transcriptional regulator [Spiribacter halobius]
MFVRVVERRGFSAAARDFDMTPSAVSRLIARLEDRLGVRLLSRSTRGVRVTQEGHDFYERAVQLLADLEDAESVGSSATAARGRLRISANVPFGHHFLIPLLPEFTAQYPQVKPELWLSDEIVDLVGEHTDVAIRAGPLKSSRLVARRLGETRLKIVASPVYLRAHGTPRVPDELEHHVRVGFAYPRVAEAWPLRSRDGVQEYLPRPAVLAGDGESVRHLAIKGLGLARLAEFQVADDLRDGRLVEVLPAYDSGDTEAVHAIYEGRRAYLPARARALIDFLAARVRFEESE